MSGDRSRLADGHVFAFSVRPPLASRSPVHLALELLGARPPTGSSGVIVVEGGVGVPTDRAEGVRGSRTDPTAAEPTAEDDVGRWVATVLPPGVLALARSAEAVVATDGRAIGEAYVTRGDGWSMASTSPLLLAAATEAAVDSAAVLRYARLGHFLGDDSPWAGIRRLGPGEVVSLRDGGVESRRVRPVATGAPTLAAATSAVVAAAGEQGGLEIELSGGLDSRLGLAACVATGVRIDRALTLGSPGDADLVVAERLATDLGLERLVIDPAELDGWDDDALLALMRSGAADRGWVANPIDTTPLDWVESARGPGVGVSGQNGEIARGFYYRGPHARQPRSRRIRALADWRLFANAGVTPDLFAADLRTTIDDVVVAALGEWLDDSSADAFLRSTDDFYLRHRMTRWVGPAYAGAARRHPVVAPFLSAGFITAAGALDVGARRRSTAVAAAVGELAPQLASVPLAGGPSPEAMASRSFRTLVGASTSMAGKAARKVAQRVGRAPARPSGTGAVTRALAGRVDELTEQLRGDPLLGADGLAAVRARPDARELAFLAGLAAWRDPRRALDEADPDVVR